MDEFVKPYSSKMTEGEISEIESEDNGTMETSQNSLLVPDDMLKIKKEPPDKSYAIPKVKPEPLDSFSEGFSDEMHEKDASMLINEFKQELIDGHDSDTSVAQEICPYDKKEMESMSDGSDNNEDGSSVTGDHNLGDSDSQETFSDAFTSPILMKATLGTEFDDIASITDEDESSANMDSNSGDTNNYESLSSVASSPMLMKASIDTQFQEQKRIPFIHDTRKQYKCYICGKALKYKESLQKHIQKHEGKIQCLLCGKSYRDKNTLKVHQQQIHSEKKIRHECGTCGKQFAQIGALREHEECHTGKKFPCNVCGKVYNFHSTLRKHSQIHSGVIYPCETCGKTFVYRHHLEEHEQLHSDKTYPCEVCGKHFDTKIYLNNHKLVHQDYKFACGICGKKFRKKFFRDQHQEGHDKTYPCPVCGKNYSCPSEVRRHSRVHTEEGFKCPDCGKAFSRKYNLKLHEKVHKNPKTNNAPINNFQSIGEDCGINQENDLSTNKGPAEKKFKCNECGKAFTRRYNLKMHEKTHGIVKPDNSNEEVSNLKNNDNETVITQNNDLSIKNSNKDESLVSEENPLDCAKLEIAQLSVDSLPNV